MFDSGLGGLTVASAMRRRLPGESLVYLGDCARNPYGTKSPALVLDMARQNLRFLLTFKPKLVVVACNTASALALPTLQKESTVPLLGVIEPGAERAAAMSRTRRAGIIGTQGTVDSGVYRDTILRLGPDMKVFQRACPLLVSIVEEGRSPEDSIVFDVVKDYLVDFLDKNIDALVLGCTHFPILKSTIARFLGPRVQIVDSAEATADTVARWLAERDLAAAAPPSFEYLTSDNPEHFRRVANRFAGHPVEDVRHVDVAAFYTST